MARGGMNHLGVTVRDLAESERRFYAPLLGFLGYDKVEDRAGTMTVWYSGAAGAAFNLWQARDGLKEEAHRRYAPGFHHFAFSADSRDDVDALHGELVRQGATILDAPREYDYTPGYYAVFFEDPDGLKFEFVHMPVIPD